MSTPTPTPEAIEAAAIAYFVAVQPSHRKPEDWDGVPGVWKKSYRDQSTAALTAAAPFIAAQAKAEALREAAAVWGAGLGLEAFAENGVEDDVSAVQATVKWLDERATEIEGKGE